MSKYQFSISIVGQVVLLTETLFLSVLRDEAANTIETYTYNFKVLVSNPSEGV